MGVIKSLLHIRLFPSLILLKLTLSPCAEKVLVFSDISTPIAIKMLNELTGERRYDVYFENRMKMIEIILR